MKKDWREVLKAQKGIKFEGSEPEILEQYKVPTIEFGKLHPHILNFSPKGGINLSKSGVPGKFKLPGKLLFRSMPILDFLGGITDIVKEERDVQKSANPERARAQVEWENQMRAHQFLGGRIPKSIMSPEQQWQ